MSIDSEASYPLRCSWTIYRQREEVITVVTVFVVSMSVGIAFGVIGFWLAVELGEKRRTDRRFLLASTMTRLGFAVAILAGVVLWLGGNATQFISFVPLVLVGIFCHLIIRMRRADV